jgi:sugar/nucleoside kinase (ribokinase family)
MQEDITMDILIFNTATVDIRSRDFAFTETLAGPGGLARCKTEDMPDYSQQQYRDWIDKGIATAGGPGNTAPLVARAGLQVAVGVNLGKGDFDGLDAQGRLFYDTMTKNHVDMSQTHIHPNLPTGTTFVYEKGNQERGGIAYFPNANNDIDFDNYKKSVEKLNPNIVYYMYSGLSDKGDANNGRDLAAFVKWCKGKGIVTIVDSHTLTANPDALIHSGASVPEYKLLEPLLPELDIFFTSGDEAKMIQNTLGKPRKWAESNEDENIMQFLDFIADRFWADQQRSRFFGVTVSNGAYEKHMTPGGSKDKPRKVESRFMMGEVIDLVGAGDSFRAGLITYVARHIEEFKDGRMDFSEAIQMGNLFACLYIKAPLQTRYDYFKSYDRMCKVLEEDNTYKNLDELIRAI